MTNKKPGQQIDTIFDMTKTRKFPLQCPSSLATASMLQRHKESKHEMIRYRCDQCGFQCATKWSLKNHIATHNPESFPCDECSHVSTKLALLKVHKRNIHEGLRNKCKLCDYTCVNKAFMKQHIRVAHEGVRYRCDECDYAGTNEHNLKIHRDSKHLGITWPCDECDFVSKVEQKLRNHKRAKHGTVYIKAGRGRIEENTMLDPIQI